MKALALGLIVGGWMVAVAGLVVSEAVAVRMTGALLGIGTSLAGLMALNRTHVNQAPWKARGR